MIRLAMGHLHLHGFPVMMAGFSVVAQCAAFFGIGNAAHFMTHQLRQVTYLCALGGLAVYATGRILIIVEKRTQARKSKQADITGDLS